MDATPPAELRFAVLWHHQIDEPHYDLLVEMRPGSDLSTWRSPVWPVVETTTLQRLKEHRRIYLQYNGLLTEGRGRVDRVAEGTCRVTPTANAIVIHFIELGRAVRLERVNAEEWDGWAVDFKPV